MGTLERMAMKVLAISAATLLVCAIVAVAMLNTTADFQDLAGKAAKAKATSKALSYGSTVTLMNPYNLYMLVQKNGEINMGGFLHGNTNIKIVSPGGKKGAVKYGDEVSLMGENGKYFLVRYSGKITSRASVIARDTKWKILGGSGGVHIADRVNFKSEFGYLHVSDDGCRSVDALTAAEKFLIGLPGQETGLKSANGIHYGEVVSFQNSANEWMPDRPQWHALHQEQAGWQLGPLHHPQRHPHRGHHLVRQQDCSPCTQWPHGVCPPRHQCTRGRVPLHHRPQ